MIINEALNRVTSRRIERRFLPSVRAASENANRKRIQDLYLEILRVRSWWGGNDRDILTDRLLFFDVYILGNRASGRHFSFFFSFKFPLEKVNFLRGARALAESCESKRYTKIHSVLRCM